MGKAVILSETLPVDRMMSMFRMTPFFSKLSGWGLLSLLLFCLIHPGCSRQPSLLPETKDASMKKLSTGNYPLFTDDMGFDGLAHAIGKSIDYYKKLPEDRVFTFADDTYSRNHMVESLEKFLAFVSTNPSQAALNKFLATHYQVYQSRGSHNDGKVLFTGYYEPILSGSPTRSNRYPYPIYACPEDLVSVDLSKFSSQLEGNRIVGRVSSQTLVPYFDRRDIDVKGVLTDKAVPIAWVSDPVDLFFLHIQGSGKICMENGHTLHIHYHSSNGHPYKSIGKALIESGKLSRNEMSMQAIRKYLKNHPEEQEKLFSGNPSYIFFKTEEDGPIGCLEEKLTTGRSLAVDRRIFPLAGLSYIQTKKPLIDGEENIQRWVECVRFVLNQDTGGAIRGPGRADLFWGNGPYAEIAAGHMKHAGNLFFLVLKE